MKTLLTSHNSQKLKVILRIIKKKRKITLEYNYVKKKRKSALKSEVSGNHYFMY